MDKTTETELICHTRLLAVYSLKCTLLHISQDHTYTLTLIHVTNDDCRCELTQTSSRSRVLCSTFQKKLRKSTLTLTIIIVVASPLKRLLDQVYSGSYFKRYLHTYTWTLIYVNNNNRCSESTQTSTPSSALYSIYQKKIAPVYSNTDKRQE